MSLNSVTNECVFKYYKVFDSYWFMTDLYVLRHGYITAVFKFPPHFIINTWIDRGGSTRHGVDGSGEL